MEPASPVGLIRVVPGRFTSGETLIIKWGGEDMAREAAIYTDLLGPLGIRMPLLYSFAQQTQGVVLVMQDVGQHNLEQLPEPEYFLEAAGELARLLAAAALELASDSGKPCLAYAMPADHFLQLLDDLLASDRLRSVVVLLDAARLLPTQLDHLYRNISPTLVHHDYHAKNLVIQQTGRVMPIDWSIAYISPHLGDLYSLVNEASAWCGLDELDILHAFALETTDVAKVDLEHLRWQVAVGGLCWLIKSLRWLVYGGTDTIPGSDAWIPDLMADMKALLTRLEHF